MIKPEIRILGFDDGAFESKSKGKVPVVGVIFRGGKFLDGALKTEVTIDGNDATEKIAKLINLSRHKQQLKVIMFDGVTLGGFNIVDIKKLHKKTGLPVIVINRKIPNLKEVENALRNFKDFKQRWKKILNAGKIKECKIQENKKVYYQSVGLDDEETEEIIKLSTTRSFIPEPLRVAHIIATALVKGESSGRA
ncbi:MAG: DUF99 family protein [Candidatus Aenigmatarchaeota archaeon]